MTLNSLSTAHVHSTWLLVPPFYAHTYIQPSVLSPHHCQWSHSNHSRGHSWLCQISAWARSRVAAGDQDGSASWDDQEWWPPTGWRQSRQSSATSGNCTGRWRGHVNQWSHSLCSYTRQLVVTLAVLIHTSISGHTRCAHTHVNQWSHLLCSYTCQLVVTLAVPIHTSISGHTRCAHTHVNQWSHSLYSYTCSLHIADILHFFPETKSKTKYNHSQLRTYFRVWNTTKIS